MRRAFRRTVHFADRGDRPRPDVTLHSLFEARCAVGGRQPVSNGHQDGADWNVPAIAPPFAGRGQPLKHQAEEKARKAPVCSQERPRPFETNSTPMLMAAARIRYALRTYSRDLHCNNVRNRRRGLES